MDTEQPIEDSVENDAPPVSGEGASDSFTTADDLPPELESRYKSMQADYTRKTQELAEQRREAENAMAWVEALQNEETRNDALRQLAEELGPEVVAEAAGFEVAQDTENELDFSQLEDDSGVADPRVDQLEAEWNAYKQAQEEQAILKEIEGFTEHEMSRLGIDNEAEQRAVLSIAATLDLDREGFPQIEAANQMLEELYGSKQKEWIGSKKASRPPLQGQQAEETFDFSNEDERRKYLAALIEADE